MLTHWLAFARGMLRRRAIAREVDEELAFHLDREAARHESLGVAAGEARRLAALQLGSPSVVRSNVADVRTTWVDLIVHRTLVLVLVGIVIGMVASGAMSRFVQSALFGVSATDLRTYAAVALGFLLLAAAVSAVPIRRALKIDTVRIINVE